MNCTEVKELLSDYYDAELSSDDRERVAAHLSNCPECSDELARFGELSGMVQRVPVPVPSQLEWQHFETQLSAQATVKVADRSTKIKRPPRRSWFSYRGLRPAIAVAALLLVAVGWFAIDSWFGHGSHNLLAADIQQYVKEFQHDPQAAQQVLTTRYDGQRVRLDEATQRVSYQPAVASGLPEEYIVDSMYVLKMPCCDCLQTICQRSDGSKFAIFEYGEEHPVSVGARTGGMAQCRGENCCLVQIDDQFASSWKKGERHISVVGIRDQAEIEILVAWLE